MLAGATLFRFIAHQSSRRIDAPLALGVGFFVTASLTALVAQNRSFAAQRRSPVSGGGVPPDLPGGIDSPIEAIQLYTAHSNPQQKAISSSSLNTVARK